ncbi:MAG TPA: hemerythrin domain-containing protein [Burkholderiales bacterium]|nr:hemerythrin domain-containing protein [Burkholderiales bacterium]
MAKRKAVKRPDAIQLLKQDHAKVKKAFKQFEKLKDQEGAQAQEIIAMVLEDLKLHTQLEEEIFYPALREVLEDDLLDEAQVEHNSAKVLMQDLERMKPGQPLYAATFTVLGEYVEHHVKEEEGEMFPKASKKVDVRALGEQILARKEQAGKA